MVKLYKKKPVVIEAIQYTGSNLQACFDWITTDTYTVVGEEGFYISTLEGDMHATPGDYIIKGLQGEFYPCKPDIFKKSYEVA